jgi:hypothetical protein
MEKNTNLCVDLKTVMQHDAHLVEGQPYTGLLTRDGVDHFIFEEACQKRRCPRNPKLFDGNYCSLVHMQNGKYQIHMKTINASAIEDRNQLAFNVYSELLNAFSIID